MFNGTKNYRKQAEEIYGSATPEELEKYHGEAVKTSYFRFMLKDKVDKGEIKQEDALKEVSIVLIIGGLEKQKSE